MNGEDRRVRRTRKLLREALVELILEKGYDAVTVQDIADRADVGHRTFYRHYAGKDDLLNVVLHEMLEEMREQIHIIPPGMFNDPAFATVAEENGRILFQHVQDNSDLYRILLQSGDVALQPLLANARLETERAFSDFDEGPFPAAIVANHMISATFSLIEWWLDNDMPYPVQTMGQIWSGLVISPTRQAIEG